MAEHKPTAVATKDHLFFYGNAQIPYTVERKEMAPDNPRKVTIQVLPDGLVIVSAPSDAANSAIHSAVMKRAKWIHENLQAINKLKEYVQPRNYVSGEMQFYLGRRYALKVIQGTEATVKMHRGLLMVSVPNTQRDKPEKVKSLLREWYRTRAHHVFTERLEQLTPQLPWVKTIPEYRILSMKKQWGSCSYNGALVLNPHLVKAPKDCIDYVILHELCHIKEHNHSERFYNLLNRVKPDWKATKCQLDSMAELLLNE